MSRHSTNPWVVLVIICLAQFMVVLDATIVNVALPHIQSSLGFKNEASLQWVINAYTLVFAGFLLLGGRAGDLRASGLNSPLTVAVRGSAGRRSGVGSSLPTTLTAWKRRCPSPSAHAARSG